MCRRHRSAIVVRPTRLIRADHRVSRAAYASSRASVSRETGKSRAKPCGASGASCGTTLHMLQQSHERCRGDAGDPCRSAERRWARGGELVANFAREAPDRPIIKLRRQQQRLVAPEGGNVALLAFEITGVAGVDFELLGNSRRERAELRPHFGDASKTDAGMSQ